MHYNWCSVWMRKKRNFKLDIINMSFQIIYAFIVESQRMTFKACSIFRLDDLNDIKNGLAWIPQKRGNNVISKERKHESDKITRIRNSIKLPESSITKCIYEALMTMESIKSFFNTFSFFLLRPSSILKTLKNAF